ncbi:2-polyprenyl-6-methoxyphenol hydroxylase [Amycolatopsis arida]|uniref:2-polyprenyl-6-methoxyphenol hydroxylase n=1 Tax=Amycolatopsis arida TaxID=587909 RepID=A0A1I5VBE2_9PSEU|nr:FAD-dependent monooxygenase [Amycolatopsis arida]TDX91214.1 2-polyprenyl-6-methoxyphenol hydroxylase-like FAD-dependent oxidoreductase [Amycolatopsis arida]SFQ04667.1 2-polyprenyl-6-methoxyphenol hydroxylase [Amycolatopsis arida]
MTRALIIGGGIAGPVTAIALRRAGIESTVYEAYDRGAEGAGAYLTLAVNGLDALGAVGLKELVQDLGFATPRVRFTNGNGRDLGGFSLGGPLPDGTVCRTILRSDVYLALRDEAVRQGVPIEYGKRLVAAVRTGDGVRATFADGSEAHGDLLVGADGLHSTVRRIIDPDAPRATYQGLLNTAGIAHGVDVDAEPGEVRMVFGKRCFFSYVPHPDGEVWWFANPVRRGEPGDAELRRIRAGFRKELLDLFAVDRTPAVELIEASPRIHPPYGTYYFPRVPLWHRDRMIVIGDAAHAASPAAGQGAAMAMEDAVVLAKSLRDAPGIDEAFAGYEAARRERVEAVVAQGARNGGNKTVGPLGRILRDFFVARTFRGQAATGTDAQRWMWDHHIEWDAPAPELA